MNHDWQNWIDRLKSEDLTESELREFERIVAADPANRSAYLDALLTEVALETEGLPDPLVRPSVVEMLPRSRHRARLLAIAAGVAFLVTGAYLIGARPGHIATVTDADEVVAALGLRIGQPLGKGMISIPDGSEIGLAMRDGARLEVRGPADLFIEGPDKVRLERGRVSTYAPSYAHGFTMDTVDGTVVDLGTRFVTATGNHQGTEVHVIEGEVEIDKTSLKGEHAAILKSGKLEPTEFLAQRLNVPLDPVLPDRDGDGFPDVVEEHYGTNPDDASSKPLPLRVEESFADYRSGELKGAAFRGLGAAPDLSWEGGGHFVTEGLSYAKDGKSLKHSGGAVRTTGEWGMGSILFPESREILSSGVTYLSFLMRTSEVPPVNCFSGLLLYLGDREELFVGKVNPKNSYGSRFRISPEHDAFDEPLDRAVHLFVIRIDRNRLVTDVFFDPVPGQAESSAVQRFRYHAVPEFDRIMVRSGRDGGVFPAVFDEIRLGLTWDSVLPVTE